MKVIKTRENTYHTSEECQGVRRARFTNEIDIEVAESWDLDPCKKCVESPETGGKSKWNEFVRERKQV